MKEKSLEYYMGLPYKIELVQIPMDEGGGWMARLPQFGEAVIIGDGETEHEAIDDLRRAQEDRFEYYLANGYKIPEPEGEQGEFSGRFLVRMPSDLHRNLAVQAERNRVSLNTHIVSLLSGSFVWESVAAEIKSMSKRIFEHPVFSFEISPTFIESDVFEDQQDQCEVKTRNAADEYMNAA